MTSEGSGEMVEGDFADTCTGIFLLMLIGGASGGYRVLRPGSKDPHWREQNLINRSSWWAGLGDYLFGKFLI